MSSPLPLRWRALSRCAIASTVTGLLGAGAMCIPAQAVPAGWTESVKDSFSRATSSGWGSAELGGSYAVKATAAVSPRVANSTGLATMPTGGSFEAHLQGVSTRDTNVADLMRLSVPSGSSYDLLTGWTARRQSDGSSYKARLRFSNSGTASLGLSRVSGGSSTWLAGATVPAVRAGQSIRGEFEVTGTSPVVVRARVWADGAATPSWQASYSDTSSSRIQAAGAAGLWSYAQRGGTSVVAARDNLSVSTPGTATAPAPPPPATTTSTGGRGSATIGSTSYAIPSGAVFVDGARGSDANSGSQSSPLRSVKAALAKAPSGGTVVVRAGTYNESAATTRTVTIQPYPNEAVWFDGSVPVTSWAQSGSRWVHTGWKAEFSNTMGESSTFKARFIGENPMAADPDQVFIDGVALRQVGSANQVTAGTFAVNDGADTLTIGTNPSGRSVRASNLAQALSISGQNSVVQGIGVRRYATPYELRGALRMGNVGGTVRNVVIQDNAMIGLSMSNSNKTVDRVTAERNGMLGIGGHQDNNSVIKNSKINGNNAQNFKNEPVSGGIKLTESNTVSIINNEASDNLATGIWFDAMSYNMTIVNNEARNNRKHQIEVEVSEKSLIANNIATGGETGILVFDTGNVRVFNNEVGGSKLFGIKLAQDERRGTTTIPFLTRNIVVANNVYGNGGYFQFYALDGVSNIAVDRMNVTINGNLFNKRVASSDPTMVAWGKGDNRTLERYETPSALAAAKNSTWRNAQVSSSKSLSSMTTDKTTYAGTAVPIPSDVATATGRLTGGTRVLGVR